MRSLSPIKATKKRRAAGTWARKGPTAGTDYNRPTPARRRPLLTRETPAVTRHARAHAHTALSNTGHKNVSTYKRRRLFHVITDFRPVNDFFESLISPRSDAYYESLPHVSRLLPLNFTVRIGIDPSPVYSFQIEIETRKLLIDVPHSYLRVVA